MTAADAPKRLLPTPEELMAPDTPDDVCMHHSPKLARAEAKLEAAEQENINLRAALAQSELPCVYCTLPKEEWSKCQHGLHGFPGCGRADDAMGCPELGASLRADGLATQLAAAEQERDKIYEAHMRMCQVGGQHADRAARAEAALVAAQEAMRESCAVFARDYAEQEFCGTINFADLYESIRALPIPVVVSASAEPTTTGNLVGSSPKGEIPFPNLQTAARPEGE